MPTQIICKTCATPFFVKPCRALKAEYCSKSCHAKGTIVKPRSNLQRPCDVCGTAYRIVSSQLGATRCCSRKCLGILQSRERTGVNTGPSHPNWKTGIQTYRQHTDSICSRCNATENLLVHHKDENRHNNHESNLETLCKRCHQIHHDCRSRLLPDQTPVPCEECAAPIVRTSHKHRFCSRRCIRSWKLRNSTPRTCLQCSSSFKSLEKSQQFCSRSCRNRSRRRSNTSSSQPSP